MDAVEKFMAYEVLFNLDGIFPNSEYKKYLTPYIQAVASLGCEITPASDYFAKQYGAKVVDIASHKIMVHESKKMGFHWAKVEIVFANDKGKRKFKEILINPKMLKEAWGGNWSSFSKDVVKQQVTKKVGNIHPLSSLSQKEKKLPKEVSSIPYDVWKKRMDEIEANYGPKILAARDKYYLAIKVELEKVAAQAKYRGMPIMFYTTGKGYEDIMFTADPKYPNYCYESAALFLCATYADAVIDYREEIKDKDWDAVSYTVGEDLARVINFDDQTINSYVDECVKVLTKYMNKLVMELKKDGVPVTGWDYNHPTEEYLCDYIIIELDTSKYLQDLK